VRDEPTRDLIDFAVEIALEAGHLTLRYFQSGVTAEFKADASPVTAVDRAAEKLCRERIESVYPEHGIIGEEFGTVRPEAPRRWILDPIDGTRSYLRGVPLYGVLVALEEGEDTVIGVLHFPAMGETVWAARGAGCWWNGRRARVSEVSSLPDALLLTTDAERLRPLPTGDAPGKPAAIRNAAHKAAGYERLRDQAGLVRTWGDCYGHALVATGRAEAMLDPVAAIWDAAALRPVIEEAGGVFSDWDGNPTHRGGSAVSTNAVISPSVRGLLRESR
jgi:histidinol-phosphatase